MKRRVRNKKRRMGWIVGWSAPSPAAAGSAHGCDGHQRQRQAETVTLRLALAWHGRAIPLRMTRHPRVGLADGTMREIGAHVPTPGVRGVCLSQAQVYAAPPEGAGGGCG